MGEKALELGDVIERDHGFWRAAYRSHAPAVLAFLQRRLGHRDVAEDLLQETFVRAIDAGSFREGNLRGYLMRIARNLVVDRFRRPRLVVPAEPAATEQPATTASPERETALNLFKEKLNGVLGELNAAQRMAFEMGVLQQQSYNEISRVTGWSLPTVKVKIYRARRKVIDRLRDHVPDLGGSVG